MILFFFVFILGASSTFGCCGSCQDKEIKKAALEFLNGISNWKMEEEITMLDACKNNKVEYGDVTELIHKRYKIILEDLKEYYSDLIIFNNNNEDNRSDNYNKFIIEIGKINQNWTNISEEARELIWEYITGILKSKDDVMIAIIRGLSRILPIDENDTLNINGLYRKLRDDLNGKGAIETMFLIDSKGKKIQVGDYGELLYAIFTLSNIKKNPYFTDEKNKKILIDMIQANENLYNASKQGKTETDEELHELHTLTTFALSKLSSIWIMVTKEKHAPYTGVLTEYFKLKEIKDNTIPLNSTKNEDSSCIQWLKERIREKKPIDGRGLFYYLQNVLELKAKTNEELPSSSNS